MPKSLAAILPSIELPELVCVEPTCPFSRAEAPWCDHPKREPTDAEIQAFIANHTGRWNHRYSIEQWGKLLARQFPADYAEPPADEELHWKPVREERIEMMRERVARGRSPFGRDIVESKAVGECPTNARNGRPEARNLVVEGGRN